MRTDRPMNEYEYALYIALDAILPELIRLGVDPNTLVSKFEEYRGDALDWGQPNTAETLKFLIDTVTSGRNQT